MDAVGAGTTEASGGKATLDHRHRNKDGEISGKHGNTVIRALRKVYGQSFAAGYPETEKLREVLKLNENLYAAALAPRHRDLVAAIFEDFERLANGG